MRHVVILGCGMAGFHAARYLEEKLAGRRRVQLTVISDQAHFVFTPLLFTVASGELKADHIAAPIDELLETRTRVVVDPITSIDFEERSLQGERDRYPFDYLIIATGSRRNPNIFQGASELLAPTSLSDATSIYQKLQQQKELPSFNASIIGAGLTGVQWAAQLASLQSDGGLPTGQINLLEAGSRILPHHSSQLAAHASDRLQRMGISIRTGTSVDTVTVDDSRWSLQLSPGETLTDQDGAFHCAGRRGSLPTAEPTHPQVDPTNRLSVDARLRLPDHHGVFAAGDITTRRQDWALHSTPQLAVQQGKWAARNLLATMSGRSLRPFELESRGDFLPLGRHFTLLELGDVVLEGRPAWLAYRLYYTSMMPQPIQRARLVMDWVARRITEKSPPEIT